MNVAGQERKHKECRGCPIWLPLEQTGFATPEKILGCIQRVLGDKRCWLTAEEFLAQVEAHRRARLKAEQTPQKPFKPGPFVREYRLWGGNWEFKPKARSSTASKLEVLP